MTIVHDKDKNIWIGSFFCPFCGKPTVTTRHGIRRTGAIKFPDGVDENIRVLVPLYLAQCFLCKEYSFMEEDEIPLEVRKQADYYEEVGD